MPPIHSAAKASICNATLVHGPMQPWQLGNCGIKQVLVSVGNMVVPAVRRRNEIAAQ